jgi:riboflavin biosynthesis pyrimidine reductase
MRDEAERLNAGFFKHVATGRPWLAIDGDASTYDGEFDLLRDESYEAALDRLGAKGWTRIFVRPGAALAAQLNARSLVDETLS